MSHTVKLVLLITAVIAIVFASIVFLITKSRIKKTRAKYRTEEANKYDHVRVNDAIEVRGETIGELL